MRDNKEEQKMAEMGLNFQDWDDFFEKIPFTFFMTAQIQKKYIETIKKYTPENGKLLEIAGGSGYTSVVVQDVVRVKNAKVTYTDLEKSLTKRVEETFGKISGLSYQAEDASKLSFADDSYDVVFHQGFLEHFDDEDIVEFLKEQARVAKVIVFDVPNGRRWDKTQEFGNERFLSHEEWMNIAKQAGLVVHEDTARRFSNFWKDWVPVVIRDSEWFHRNFGESSIIVCGKE
ncbi:MAG: class I SAM-dependent methyltransferase [Cellvibrionaceae bacterium]